jgi:lambda family phage portal protein
MLDWMQKRWTAMQRSMSSMRPQTPAGSRPRGALLQTQVSRLKTLLGRYDAATTTLDNSRHWAAADGLSANAANSPEVRRILRNRARYEVANNSYARGMVLTLANDVIGTGPRLQLLTQNDEANQRIEHAFMMWSKAVRLPEKLRTMRMARATDGEAFALLTNNPKLPTDIQLDLRLIEAEQVTTPDLNWLGDRACDGIEFDSAGNPATYHILRSHPGERMWNSTQDYDRVSASSVLHWYRADRAGQARGIPDIMPALPLFAQLRRFTLAVLAAAETAADFAGILYTDAPAGGEADAAEPFEPIELEKRALLTMPGGWRMEQMRSEQPSTSYSEFKHELLNEIARCLNMPYNVAAANSSGYNYASGRLDHQTYFKAIRVEQSHLECAVLDRILAAWFDEAALLTGFIPEGLGPFAQWPHQWFWDGHEHVDPAKEANAQATRLASLTTTLADEYARRGQDWETQLRQRAKELTLMKQLGLTIDQSIPTETPDDTDEADANEETARAA